MKIRAIKSLLLSPCALTFSFLVLILFSCSKDSDGTGFSGDSGDGEIPPVVNPEDVLPEEVDGNVIVYHTLNSNVLIFEDSTVFGDLKILSNTYSSSSNYGKIVFGKFFCKFYDRFTVENDICNIIIVRDYSHKIVSYTSADGISLKACTL